MLIQFKTVCVHMRIWQVVRVHVSVSVCLHVEASIQPQVSVFSTGPPFSETVFTLVWKAPSMPGRLAIQPQDPTVSTS